MSELPTAGTGRVDLHTHTTASDGDLDPGELVELSHRLGVRVLSITDHDTVGGLSEGAIAAARLGIALVPGIELSCDLEHAHADMLGYFIDPTSAELDSVLQRIQQARVERARRMVDRLRKLGAPITCEDVTRLSGTGVVARPHIALTLVEAGFVPDVSTAFQDYIGRDGPAYVDRYRLTPQDACRLIRSSGGVPTLAHPVPPNDPLSDPLRLRSFLPQLVPEGLGGLECRYPGYSPSVVRWLEALADHNGLIATGGSDYHGQWRRHNELGCVDVPSDAALRLAAEAGGTGK